VSFILLVRQTRTGISAGDIQKFPQSFKFYVPGKNVPLVDSTHGHKQAVDSWFARQPGLIKPNAPTFTIGSIEVYLIDQDWKRDDGRPSDWSTAWTVTYGWSLGLRHDLHKVIEKLKELRLEGKLS